MRKLLVYEAFPTVSPPFRVLISKCPLSDQKTVEAISGSSCICEALIEKGVFWLHWILPIIGIKIGLKTAGINAAVVKVSETDHPEFGWFPESQKVFICHS